MNYVRSCATSVIHARVRMRYPFRRALKDNGARFAFLHPLLVTKNKKQISNRI